MTAASPGVISLFFRNEHYPSHEAYLFAIADAMRHEYEAVARAGLVLQVDCPDLGMGRHIQFADLVLDGFRTMARLHVDGAESRAGQRAARVRRDCISAGAITKGRITTTSRSPTSSTSRSRRRTSAVSFEASNPRHAHEWRVFETVKVPAGKVIIPGVLDSTTNFIEHPDLVAERIGRYARLCGRENVIAGTDCGFGTWVGQAAVDPDIVWAKLASMAEGARRATKDFW